ncbi:MAG: UbiA family prenyltransferase [Patescibacteria group bacterium]
MIKIKDFFINFFRLTRPLSNVKNIALVLVAFYFSKSEFNFWLIFWPLISLSLVCSAFYTFNTISDFDSDKNNENKKHYSEAASYFGQKKGFAIFLSFLIAGLFIGYFVNLYFFVFLLFLALTDFLYSFKFSRFKEKFILDVLFGASFTFLLRFLAFWFVFSSSFPPLLVLSGLFFGKSAGYFLYKSFDYPYLLNKNIKNSVTILSKKTKIIVSILFWALAFISYAALCFNYYLNITLLGALPPRFLLLTIFAIIPLAVIYLSFFNIIKTEVKKLRILGYIYWLAVMVIILKLL